MEFPMEKKKKSETMKIIVTTIEMIECRMEYCGILVLWPENPRAGDEVDDHDGTMSGQSG